MASIRLTWSLPTVTTHQQPIARTLVEISAAPQEVGWTEHRVIAADVDQTVTFADAAPGAHHFRLTVIDLDGRRSPPVTLSATVPHRGPSPVEDAEAVVV